MARQWLSPCSVLFQQLTVVISGGRHVRRSLSGDNFRNWLIRTA
jgi:hypothetical protein